MEHDSKLTSNAKKSVTKNIYEFIKMENPDGQFMCYSSHRRAEWYISRGLAEWVEGQENTFRLNFEPQGNGKADVPYYSEKVENRCVCCGTFENMTRHHVFPYMFKSRLPVQYKSRSNYDILPVCSSCHENYERQADLVKRDLENQVVSELDLNIDKQEIKRIKSVLASRRFLEQYDEHPTLYKNVPLEKVMEHEENASQEIDEMLLEKSIMNKKYWVEKLMATIERDEQKLFEFVKMWRKHFVDTMQPKFMPNLWVIDMEVEVTNEYRQAQEKKKLNEELAQKYA